MADTLITNTNPPSGNGIGWVVTFLLALIVFFGGIVLYQKGYFDRPETKQEEAINIDVNIPTRDNSDQQQQGQ